MRRVASLVLPNLAIDRLRRLDLRSGRPPDHGVSTLTPAGAPLDAPIGDGDTVSCSCPRGGGWRPGARWARPDGAGAIMSRDAEIAAMPVHQRPSSRELGRRSEAADHPFRAMRVDEAGRGGGIARVLTPAPSDRRPLVTARADRQRIVIAAADAGAQALGLMPGMALTHARALVPGLDVRDDDPAADHALIERLGLFALRRWTPIAMIDGADGLLLDVTGVAHLFGGEVRMARRIVRFCARLGYEARVAIAGTIGAAHALARFGHDAVTICSVQREAAALAGLPVVALRPESHQRETAHRLGIQTIGDLLAMPRAPLARRFGASMVTRLDQAIGRAGEPFDAIVPIASPQAELRFAEPIASAEAIGAVIAELAAMLVALLRERGLGARLVGLACDRVDGATQTIIIGMARGTREPAHLLRLLAMRIETIDPGFGIDAMRMIALRYDPLGALPIDGDLGGEVAPRDIALLVDQLVTRLGERNLYRPSAVESDVPERSVRRIAPLAVPAPFETLWRRPARLLRRPERLDKVIALMPDQPPRRFAWRGTTHIVARGDGPERITGEWWKRTAEARSVRDYFRVEDERGARFWLFRRGDGVDPGTGDLSWYMHGLFG